MKTNDRPKPTPGQYVFSYTVFIAFGIAVAVIIVAIVTQDSPINVVRSVFD
jgi:hypothetical protein